MNERVKKILYKCRYVIGFAITAIGSFIIGAVLQNNRNSTSGVRDSIGDVRDTQRQLEATNKGTRKIIEEVRKQKLED